MTLNVSNHNGTLLADHFHGSTIYSKSFILNKSVFGRHFGLSDHVLTSYYRGSGWLPAYQQAYIIDVLAQHAVILSIHNASMK